MTPKPKAALKMLDKSTCSRSLCLFVMCFTSCVPVESMIYLQPDGRHEIEVFEYDKQEYQLQMNDILDVKILLFNPED